MTAEPVIDIRQLTKRYGEFTALNSLTLQVPAGHVLGLIGPNGAGKTTAIRILAGLLRPTSGTATIAGADCVKQARDIKRLIGYMPDRFGSYDNMRVHEYLDFFGAAFGIPRRQRITRIEEVMETAGIVYMRDKFVESLSHGMAQRVGIARTLLHDPRVIILDEPANGLDPQARIEMRELILKLARLGKTVLVTSHILPELARICDTVAIMTHGCLRAFGTVDQIGHQISQRRTMEAQLLSVDKISLAAEIIRKGIEADAEVIEAPAEAIVRFRTAVSEETLGQLLSELVRNQIPVTQFRELQTDLEEAFMTFANAAPTGDGKATVAGVKHG
ncbi:MAG: ABC transporter ATP-binding protein [Planctomycetaceae bacterium]